MRGGYPSNLVMRSVMFVAALLAVLIFTACAPRDADTNGGEEPTPREIAVGELEDAPEQMAAGHFEAALLPSLAYVLAHDRYDVRVALKAVRHGSPTYRGQIITRVDSGIDTLEDLRGRTFGFTDVSSASGHLYPKTLLINSGIDPDTDLAEVTFVGSQHAAVIEAVLHGRIDAGACFDDARTLLEETEPQVMQETKVVAYTPQIPADTVSLRADCVGPFYDRLVEALMELSREGEESPLLSIYTIEELVPAEDTDYDPIRQMVTTLNIDIEAELE
jgi:phosphonate transport system substrate-binding protein